jgi:hypothetical protein
MDECYDNQSQTEMPLTTEGKLTLTFPTADPAKGGYFLRWSRIHKCVEVKEASSGILRSSIAATTTDSEKPFQKSGPVHKTILLEASGCAAPGEVLALMGPSGSG